MSSSLLSTATAAFLLVPVPVPPLPLSSSSSPLEDEPELELPELEGAGRFTCGVAVPSTCTRGNAATGSSFLGGSSFSAGFGAHGKPRASFKISDCHWRASGIRRTVLLTLTPEALIM
jgi:hypothetical protein